MSAELHQTAGRHEEAINTIKADLSAMKADIAAMKEMMAQTKGGWRTLMAVGAIASGVGAAVVKGLAYLKGAG